MRHDQIVAEDSLQRIVNVVIELFEKQDPEGRASLIGFCHLLRQPERAFVRLDIDRGRAVLLIEAPLEAEE